MVNIWDNPSFFLIINVLRIIVPGPSQTHKIDIHGLD